MKYTKNNIWCYIWFWDMIPLTLELEFYNYGVNLKFD